MANAFIGRQVLLGLLFAQAATVLLHWSRLPIWILLLAIVVFIWRVQIFRNQWSFPNRLVRSFLVFASLVAVVSYYREWYALEPMVILLIISFLLKLLEVDRQRDAIVLVFVGYFVMASTFLFEQTIIATVIGICVLWFLTNCLLVLHGSNVRYFSRRTTKVTGVLLLQAVPLMLLMLFVFPRIGALWSVPLQSSSAVTGVSDSMSPGDFSQLTRSRKLAFRVSFDDDIIPTPSQRYWRGLVLTDFDGRRWQREKGPDIYVNKSIDEKAYTPIGNQPIFNYEIVLETTNTAWLYGIPLASVKDKRFQRSVTNELWLSDPVTQRMKYRVASAQGYSITESPQRLLRYLSLPDGFNPQTISMARKWKGESNSDEDYIENVLNFYRESFTYTLSPPKLGRNTADEFLFSTQQGFCEHFSSSFVILMRAAGIPARVVAGYQGGEWNEANNYLIVRQYDAHAWAEVWLSGKGWVRIDPTAAVAPNRIEQGLLDSLSDSEQDLIDDSPLPSFQWINRLALQWDSINYRWQRWVLSYDEEVQSKWLEKILGEITASRLAVLLVAPAMLMLLVFSFLTLRNNLTPQAREVKLYHKLKRKLISKGVILETGDTLAEIFQKSYQAFPEKKSQLTLLETNFTNMLYASNKNMDDSDYKHVRRILSSI
jgi:transglutaminase-like putative cysteine protease